MKATQTRGHCQCCGRQQAVQGNVAKHGYTVKDRGSFGWFSGVCPGAQSEPMELDRTVTDSIIKMLREIATREAAAAAGLRSGGQVPETARTGRSTFVITNSRREVSYETVPWAEAAEHQRRSEIERLAHEAEQKARHATSDADSLGALAARVHGQPLLEIERPAAPEPIQFGEKREAKRGTLTARDVSRGMVRWIDGRGFKGAMSTRNWRLLNKTEA